MLLSMTGFGKSVCEFSDKKIIVEIKSLNSKQLDANVRLPQIYREKELWLRNKLSEKLDRGKVDFTMFIENNSGIQTKILNKEVIKSYVKQIKDLELDLELNIDNILHAVLRLPDVLNSEPESFDENEWKDIEKAVETAIIDLNSFRQTEGAALETDLKKRINIILDNIENIKLLENNRIDKIKERIMKLLEEFVGGNNIDQNRFEQELIFYLEKIDITEEKVRLAQHCEFFIQNIKEGSPIGKKLNFIAQEIGREINTIGSKANDADIQRHVVVMKDELEKIKEQSLNIL